MTWLYELWNSIDRLARLITYANWGIACSLLLGFVFTAVVIKAGNRKDELATMEGAKSTARIAELGHDTEKLKSGNLKLGIDLETQKERAATAEGKIAGLQKDASEAKSAQLEVETKLSAQEAETARAKSDLAKLQVLVQWRTVTPEQSKKFLTATMNEPKGEVHVKAQADDPESISFAVELRQMLVDAGFNAPPVATAYVVGVGSIGLSLQVNSAATLTHPDPNMPSKYFIPNGSPVIHSGAVKVGLDAAGMAVNVNVNSGSRNNEVVLQVGRKP
jgi:hypothetical protein